MQTGTDVTSVKKIMPVCLWIFTSFKELNWRPKKLSRMTVALLGLEGFTKATLGGSGPRPLLTRINWPWKGPVPPLVI